MVGNTHKIYMCTVAYSLLDRGSVRVSIRSVHLRSWWACASTFQRREPMIILLDNNFSFFCAPNVGEGADCSYNFPNALSIRPL